MGARILRFELDYTVNPRKIVYLALLGTFVIQEILCLSNAMKGTIAHLVWILLLAQLEHIIRIRVNRIYRIASIALPGISAIEQALLITHSYIAPLVLIV